jgi:hypothetical protein
VIRFLSLIARRPDVSKQEFHDHWRHPHGTMGRLIPGLLDYVQAHQIDTALLGPGQAEYEGVAISGVDSPAAADKLLREPQYVDKVAPDEPSFQDLPRNRFFSTEEEVLASRPRTNGRSHPADVEWNVLDRPTSVALLQFVHLDGDSGWAGEQDAELGDRLRAFRHVRNRPSTDVHGADAPFLGARQLWWPTISAFEEGARADPGALAELVDGAGHAITMLTISERFLR